MKKVICKFLTVLWTVSKKNKKHCLTYCVHFVIYLSMNKIAETESTVGIHNRSFKIALDKGYAKITGIKGSKGEKVKQILERDKKSPSGYAIRVIPVG
jgi:hypothetical protein